MKTYALTLLATASVLALTGCKDNQENVAAVVNGTEISAEKISEQLLQIPAQLIQGREAEIRTQILDQLIQQQLVIQKAEEMDIVEDEAYQTQLTNFENQLKYNMVIQKYLEDAITDDMLLTAYEENKAQLAYPAVRARHILLQSKQEAEDIIKIATPANFAQLATERSTGPSAPQGGDLGYFRKEAMVPAFAEVAFNTAKGNIAKQPIQTQFGWHVVFVEDKQDAFLPPFETVKEQLRQSMMQPKAQEFLNKLREDARITFPDTQEEAEEATETAE